MISLNKVFFDNFDRPNCNAQNNRSHAFYNFLVIRIFNRKIVFAINIWINKYQGVTVQNYRLWTVFSIIYNIQRWNTTTFFGNFA